MRPSLLKKSVIFFIIFTLCASSKMISQCAYDMDLTSSDLLVQGTIFSTQADGIDVPQEIEWYLPLDEVVISTAPTFEFLASDYGACTICADLTVSQADGSTCSETICKNVNLVDSDVACEAYFDFHDYTGPMPVVGGITFNNFSTGSYSEWTWDFGDGNFESQSEASITHFYQESGTYEVKLTVWSADPQECNSEYTQSIDVFISENPCDQLDCVWPGDANKDGFANMEDLLNVGIGYGMTGPPRDIPSNDWTAQTAMDWDLENPNGINYKHFDCDGNGIIEINDILAVQSNYVMMENGVSITESNGVPVSLNFDVDTIVITEENPYLEINAALNFGNSNIPMDNVYGVVLYLTYPKNYVVEAAPIDFDYNENSFFGDNTTALPLARNIQEEGQIDIVLTRKNGANTSGQGRVASVKFIIDADIIDGRVENDGETFEVGINVVKAIDFEGNIIDISLPEEPSGVFFQNGISTTKTIDVLDEDQVKVFPNPVRDQLRVELSEELHPKTLEVFNIMGQRVIFNEINTNRALLNVSELPKGVYILKVITEEGVGSKRIIIEK